ncbi:YcxB family protein [Salmonella enterica]|uniref:YcxB family protein n=1 Tax=Salmonella enterica TaxID=28901 RepID=A0A3V7Z0Z5_SALER|nr:YcxB family protein [Salmonella enterica]EDV3838297.1 YcxB family protein [Salmonella enterica subsp. diarizonae]EAZ3130094.1 YcxB family protein [Salmonella enterica]MMS79616.1 YcxB family protein [Salmonella enterica]HAF4830108.1 YcxB family protein [Salmonella enterica]
MLHNDQKEKEDGEISVHLKINRFYIEQIQMPGSIKAFWNYTKKVYRGNGFIFIQRMDNRCIVIPERIFTSEDDIIKLYDYIKEQISKHKR